MQISCWIGILSNCNFQMDNLHFALEWNFLDEFPKCFCRGTYALKRRLRIRTLQFATAQNISEIYDSVVPEVVLSLLVHKVIPDTFPSPFVFPRFDVILLFLPLILRLVSHCTFMNYWWFGVSNNILCSFSLTLTERSVNFVFNLILFILLYWPQYSKLILSYAKLFTNTWICWW